jgi:hypothetical protein
MKPEEACLQHDGPDYFQAAKCVDSGDSFNHSPERVDVHSDRSRFRFDDIVFQTLFIAYLYVN